MATNVYTRTAPVMDGIPDLVLIVSAHISKLLENPERMPTPGVTAYKDVKFLEGKFNDKFKDYVFLKLGNDDGRAEYQTLTFGKDYSAVNPDTDKPWNKTPVLDFPDVKEREWDPMLRAIKPVEDTSDPIVSTDTSGRLLFTARYQVLEDYVPGGMMATRHRTRIYLSAVPHAIPNHLSPVAASVSIFVPGFGHKQFPLCLHPRLEIGPLRSGFANFNEDTATPGDVGGAIPGRVFPPTNFPGWELWTPSDTQVQSASGIWIRTRIDVSPPEEPPAVITIG